jgi:hypothetical protein
MSDKVPNQMTKSEALAAGYTLCGYRDMEDQILMQITDIDADNFEMGTILIADPEKHSAKVSADYLIDHCVDLYFEFDENPDETEDMIDMLKAEKAMFEEFAGKINKIYEARGFYYLIPLLKLVPDPEENSNA